MAEHAEHQTNYTARIILSWTIVSVPLIYGLTNAIIAATQLFG